MGKRAQPAKVRPVISTALELDYDSIMSRVCVEERLGLFL